MSVDCRSAQNDFGILVSKLQPTVLTNFIIWLDVKVAEFKLHGHMNVAQHEITSWFLNPMIHSNSSRKRRRKETVIDCSQKSSGSKETVVKVFRPSTKRAKLANKKRVITYQLPNIEPSVDTFPRPEVKSFCLSNVIPKSHFGLDSEMTETVATDVPDDNRANLSSFESYSEAHIEQNSCNSSSSSKAREYFEHVEDSVGDNSHENKWEGILKALKNKILISPGYIKPTKQVSDAVHFPNIDPQISSVDTVADVLQKRNKDKDCLPHGSRCSESDLEVSIATADTDVTGQSPFKSKLLANLDSGEKSFCYQNENFTEQGSKVIVPTFNEKVTEPFPISVHLVSQTDSQTKKTSTLLTVMQDMNERSDHPSYVKLCSENISQKDTSTRPPLIRDPDMLLKTEPVDSEYIEVVEDAENEPVDSEYIEVVEDAENEFVAMSGVEIPLKIEPVEDSDYSQKVGIVGVVDTTMSGPNILLKTEPGEDSDCSEKVWNAGVMSGPDLPLKTEWVDETGCHEAGTSGEVVSTLLQDKDGKQSSSPNQETDVKTKIIDPKATDNRDCLWKYLVTLLENPKKHSKIIKWTDRENGIFQLVDPHKVSHLWGIQRHKPKMTYESMSRSLRTYYEKKILRKVDFGKKCEYQFIPKLVL